ncbi:MAG: metal-sulfur cluster assembly factor [Bacteroidales bacterium]|jgi:metal-sulfur cluster biosynthetic enzyme|nr:metal-sulfur cluster assembly factor [Bacteroidales bacterium]NLK79768.1 metal-sulfur cluster assembly factor [Bacteroidales bacterium]HKM30732.1 metal-sulfur cluster assembly factor [Bacteroidales bacterium]
MELEEKIKLALKQVFDAELGINIVDLGLVYNINIKEKTEGGSFVTVTMTLTSPHCPLADEMIEDAQIAVSQVPGVSKVSIDLTFEPPWEPSLMSDEALLDSGLYGMY